MNYFYFFIFFSLIQYASADSILYFLLFLVFTSITDGFTDYCGIALIVGGIFLTFCGYISFFCIN